MKPLVRLHAAGGMMLALAGCSPAQLAQFSSTASNVSSALTMACNDAITAANIAGLVPGVGAIVPYINAGCATGEGIAKLAADPSSTAWLGQMTGEIKTLASNAGIKLP